MKIQSVSYNNNNVPNRAFRSVYPIYHWHKEAGQFAPVFDVETAKKYQKQILGILNRTKHLCGKFSEQFIKEVHELLSEYDKDFGEEPCALSFYDQNAGVKRGWDGNIYDIKPCTYLITGKDALFFEKYYRRPIGHVKFDAKMYNTTDSPETKQALLDYYFNGRDFVNQKVKDFNEKVNMELHTIFEDDRPVKIGFCPKAGSENPFVKMGYYDTTSQDS